MRSVPHTSVTHHLENVLFSKDKLWLIQVPTNCVAIRPHIKQKVSENRISRLTYLTRTSSSLVSCFFHTVASEGSRGLSLFASLVTLSHRAYREAITHHTRMKPGKRDGRRTGFSISSWII